MNIIFKIFMNKIYQVYQISDSTGETLDRIFLALKAQFTNEIHEATQKLLADKVPAGLRWLSELAESAESESVRLGAVKDLLDRAGLKPVERIETTTIESMSKEEIERELDALLKH